MIGYHLKTAVTSLKRNPVLSILLIAGIALGICVSTAFVTLRHLFVQDHLPGKSEKVHFVRLDSWSREQPYNENEEGSLPDQVTYRDARGLLRSTIPVRQTPTFITSMFAHPDPKVARPFQPDVRLVMSDFFDMFSVPFQYGGPWTKAADAKPEYVVVIDDATNQAVFGGENSVGKTLRLNDNNYRIVGVLAPWRPALRLFELGRYAVGPPEPVYIPFNLIEPLQIWTTGNSGNWRSGQGSSHAEFLNSEAVFIQYWVELADSAAVAAYSDWIRNYIVDQKKIGRFPRETYFKLTTIPGLIEEWNLMPKAVTAMSIVSLLFLAVSSLNLVGILLGKFLSRVPEISVRRALGATRGQIFWQHIIECELIGLIGGALGILMSLGILAVLARYLPNGDALSLDGEMLAMAAFLSLAAGLVAGIYPAWRVCSVAPAMQLKVQ